MLMETGMWTMEARIDYRKMMLFHNIKNSEQERVIKQILEVQEDEARTSTWYAGVKKAVEKYGITKKVDEVLKSAWKKEKNSSVIQVQYIDIFNTS